jgi:hypothetical protein
LEPAFRQITDLFRNQYQAFSESNFLVLLSRIMFLYGAGMFPDKLLVKRSVYSYFVIGIRKIFCDIFLNRIYEFHGFIKQVISIFRLEAMSFW